MKCAKQSGAKIFVPTGAIAGIDALTALREYIRNLKIRTTKKPATLGKELTKREKLFSGLAKLAVDEYPKNINVAATMELATGHDVNVELWADPEIEYNTHEVWVESDFAKLYFRVENVPSKTNPRTSYLAPLSVIALLRKILEEPVIYVGV